MTARKPAKVQLCPECRLDNGWHYPDDGGDPFRCPNLTRAVSPEQERDDALAATSAANPNAKRAALLIITDTARANETFSANTCRALMEAAQVPGPVIGAAFGQAVRDGLIRRDGYVASTQAATHGHPVAQWRSLIYRGRVSA